MTLPLAQRLETAHGAEFADAMSRLAAGVTVVTCRRRDRAWGTTVTAFTSVSVDPPTVLISLASLGASAGAIERTARFGVSILAHDQQGVARYCSTPGTPKFLERFVSPSESRSPSPMIAGALAHLDCELVDQVELADHTVFVGRVHRARSRRHGLPLVYAGRRYRGLTDLPRRPASKGERS
jgi:flavin reductase (DIM6/NTAB) family NADH-FMN oxidoreductase RutF